tara:strand:+ start:830 stop:1042 length:213 start_codon:yes stop_codon:yes gene_type:complete
MEITIKQSSQGLLSIDINGKPSDWKISNSKGIWNLYKTEPNYLKINDNLASIIHKPELNSRVAELIKENS